MSGTTKTIGKCPLCGVNQDVEPHHFLCAAVQRPTPEEAMQQWAKAAYERVKGERPALWRYLLTNAKRDWEEDGIDMPYGSPYLVALAQTYEAVEGDFDRGVSMAVLVAGRHMLNLLAIIEPGMTVKDLKAHHAYEST